MGLGVWIEITKLSEDARQQIKDGGKVEKTGLNIKVLNTDGMIIPEESEGKWVKGAEGGKRKKTLKW